MNRYKIFIFVTVFWWSLLCPTLGFPSDVVHTTEDYTYSTQENLSDSTTTQETLQNDNASQNTTQHLSSEDTKSRDTSKIQIKPRFKYLTFLNKYLED